MSQTPQRHRKSLLKPARRISGIPSAATIAWINSKSNNPSNLTTAPTLPNLNPNPQSVVRKITFSHNENDNGNSNQVSCPKIQSTNEVMNNINNKLKKRHSLGPNFLNALKGDQASNSKKKGKKFATLPKQNRKIITVHIDSIWSEDDAVDTYIELAMLALLDDENHVIPISNIATIPDCENLEDLDKLLNMSYDKGDQIFKGCYNTKTRLSFVLSINDSFSPKTLRIWNPDSKTNFSVKDISVYEGSMLVAQGSVPQQFGMNLPLIQNDYINPDIHPKINVYYDKYGIMPIKQVKSVQIYFTETYCKERDFKKEILKEIEREKSQKIIKENLEDEFKTARENDELITMTSSLSMPSLNIYQKISEENKMEIKHKKVKSTQDAQTQYRISDSRNENDTLPQKIEMFENHPIQIGLNGIDFIDLSGQILIQNDIEEVEIHGLINVSNYEKLFKQNKETDDDDEMFIGNVLEGKVPFLDIKFKQPQYLSKIFIWNYNVNGDCLSFGAKAAKVYFDSKLFWYGKIPMGVGNVFNIIHSIRQIHVNQYLDSTQMKNKEL